MPKKFITNVTKSLGGDQLQSGYEWTIDHFGPPIGDYKGMPRKTKEELDRLTDEQYCHQIAEFANTNWNKLKSLMCSEYERVRTLYAWNGPIPHKTLTRSGFFSVRGYIACAFCDEKHAISSLKSDDEKTLQTKHQPDCPLMNGEAHNNLPFHGRSIASIRTPYNYLFSRLDAKPHALQPVKCDDNELEKIVKEKAAYKEYSTLEARLQSFKERKGQWKSEYPFDKVSQLCDAGFFYPDPTEDEEPKGDKIICFFCDGSLEAWEKEDEPWEEHMKAYPKCAYMYMRQGEVKITEIWNGLTLTQKSEYEQLYYNFDWLSEYKGELHNLPVKSESGQELKLVDSSSYIFAKQKGYEEEKLKELWYQDRRAFRSAASLIKILHEKNCPAEQTPVLESTMESDMDTDQRNALTDPDKSNVERPFTCLADDCAQMRTAVVLPCGCLTLCSDCSSKAGDTLRYCPLCHGTIHRSTIIKLE